MLSSINLLNFSGKSFERNRLTHVTPCLVSVKYLLTESTKFEIKSFQNGVTQPHPSSLPEIFMSHYSNTKRKDIGTPFYLMA